MKELLAKVTGLAEHLKESLVNACEGFEEGEQVTEEEIEEWDALLEEANRVIGKE
jgi:hypothetical protein